MIRTMAKKSCKTCYGTGVYATLVNKDGSRVRLVCQCVAEAMKK